MNTSTIKREAFMLLAHVSGVSEEELSDVIRCRSERNVFFKRKKSGGLRKIVAAHPMEYKLQRRLLDRFFNQLMRRQRFYWHEGVKSYLRRKWVRRPTSVRPILHASLHGGCLGRGVGTALQTQAGFYSPFLIKADLKNAFGSVTEQVLRRVLRSIFLDEFLSYYEANQFRRQAKRVGAICDIVTERLGESPYLSKSEDHDDGFLWESPRYKEREATRKKWLEDAHALVISLGFGNTITPDMIYDLHMGYKPEISKRATTWASPRCPLFPAKWCPGVREIIRRAVRTNVPLEETEIPAIIEAFLDVLLPVITHEGVLPQGAPTSSFLLNLVLSETGVLEGLEEEVCESDSSWKPRAVLSVYVDDILISVRSKPTKETIQQVRDIVAASDVFRCHPRKVRVYDLRNGSASVLGAKLAIHSMQGETEPGEFDKWLEEGRRHRMDNPPPPGFARAWKTKRPWLEKKVTLSRATQMKYRAMLYQLTKKEKVEELELSKAYGYLAHAVAIYGWDFTKMPSALGRTVFNFRLRFAGGEKVVMTDWFHQQSRKERDQRYKRSFKA